ncbi:cell division protein FtsX [Acidobacteriota bacterium]
MRGKKVSVDSVKRFYARFRGKGARRFRSHDLKYCVEEACVSFMRRPLMNALTVAVMTLSLVALGGVAFVGSNLNRIVTTWGEAIQLNAYLEDGIEEAALEAVKTMLGADATVETFTFIDKEEALERFGSTFRDMGLLSGFSDENPFPPSFEIRMKPGHKDPESISALAGRLEKTSGVEEVDADLNWLRKLFFSVKLFRWAGWTLASILLFASVFTIYNIIRLTLYHRQDEIEIMRLVGASEPMIRAPFILEGVLQGLMGGVLSLVLLFLFYRVLVTALVAAGFPLEVYGGVRFLSPGLSLLVVLFGSLAGLIGGSFAFIGLGRDGFDRHLL